MEEKLICLLTGGDLFRILIRDQWYLFEMHPYLGPCPLRKRDQVPRTLGPKHPFWTAATLWAQQGKRVGRMMDDVGLCVWDDVPLVTYKPWKREPRRPRL